MNVLFYVKRDQFSGDTEQKFDPNTLDPWLEADEEILNRAKPGDCFWVATFRHGVGYLLVAKMMILSSGKSTHTHGKFRVDGDPTNTTLYELTSQPPQPSPSDFKNLVGQLSFGSPPRNPFQLTFFAADHVRELTPNDQQLLEQWAQQHLKVV